MFDNIVIKHDLPLPEEIKTLEDWKSYPFQTKDLDNCMIDYFVEDGLLYEKIVEREYIEYTEEEKKQNRKKKGWHPIFKDVIEKSSRNEKIDHHGTITFYTYDQYDDLMDYWVEFRAYFSYGKLDKIEFVEFKKDPRRNMEWVEKMKLANKHPWKVFKKYARYFGWGSFWRFVSRIVSKISSIFNRIHWFIVRHIL